MTTGAAATSRCVRKYTAAATLSNTTPTKNTRRPSRSRYRDDAATLDELREAVTTLEDAGRIARRVLGGAHPIIPDLEGALRKARATLRARGDVDALRSIPPRRRGGAGPREGDVDALRDAVEALGK